MTTADLDDKTDDAPSRRRTLGDRSPRDRDEFAQLITRFEFARARYGWRARV